MRISFNWISDFVDIDADPSAVADALTLSGTEVEEIDHVTIPEEVVCARIIEKEPHPNADSLHLCKVDTGGEELQIVCGAPNVRQGMLTALAPIGTKLGDSMVVKKAKIRGVDSYGVLASERELGLTDDHTGIMEIEDKSICPGDILIDKLKLEDWVFDISVTPNRGDCLSVIGIARELAAIFNTSMKYSPIEPEEDKIPIDTALSVEIEAVDACPRYCARVLKGLHVAKSPFWMRRRLFLSGARAINNVVDITNYVMLECGQPLHAFDYDLIGEHTIVVRKAYDGETFVTLDSTERSLLKDALLICDKEKAVALAGIMGGENSEMSDDSKEVVLESAYFDPVQVRKTSSRLNLSTEASYRFERGVDPDGQKKAVDRAASLMARLADARVLKGVIDVNHLESAPRKIYLRKKRLEKILGASNVKISKVEAIFKGLGFEITSDEGGWGIIAPLFRHDIEREIDLIEEYVRIDGMDNVPSDLPRFEPQIKPSDVLKLRDIRTTLSAMGFNEVITYSFISPRWGEWFKDRYLELKNPISDEMAIMRTSLIPGLASVVARNKRIQLRDVHIFEIGKCFLPVQDNSHLPTEIERLGIASSGSRKKLHWSEEAGQVDFYDMKGIVESIVPDIEFRPSNHIFFTPGIQADVYSGSGLIGYIGALNPDIIEYLDLSDDIYVMEIELETLLIRKPAEIGPLPRFPSICRDISLVVDSNIIYEDIEGVILSKGIKDLRQIEVIDVYRGEKLPQDKNGITLRITYQSATKTLEDKVINKWQKVILDTLREKLGIYLRQT